MSAKFKRHYEARLESIADYVKVWFVVYVYGVQSWREVAQCDSKEEAERLAAQRNARMHAAKTKGLRHLAPCPFCGCKPRVDSMIFRDIGRTFFVSCESRRCGVNPCTNHRATRADAIAAWNRRAKKEGGDHA